MSSRWLRRTGHEQISISFERPLVQNPSGVKPDSIFDRLGFGEVVDHEIGKAPIDAEIVARELAPKARYYRLEHIPPALCQMDVAGTKLAAFEVAELVQHKQRLIADIFKVTVP